MCSGGAATRARGCGGGCFIKGGEMEFEVRTLQGAWLAAACARCWGRRRRLGKEESLNANAHGLHRQYRGQAGMAGGSCYCNPIHSRLVYLLLYAWPCFCPLDPDNRLRAMYRRSTRKTPNQYQVRQL